MLPSSGEEYLRMVRAQAESCPNVVVAKGADQFLSVKNTSWKYRTDWKSCVPAPEGCTPTEPWRDQFMAEFELARKALMNRKQQASYGHSATVDIDRGTRSAKSNPPYQRLPDLQDEDAWRLIMYGPQDQSFEDKPSLESSGGAPRPQFLIRLNQGCVMRLLKYHLRWLRANDISEQEGRWLYALLLKLDPLLESHDIAVLRSLAKKCSYIRSHLNSESGHKLASVNMVITVVARLFGQNDLE
ncbi:gem associated protein 2 [Entomortierella parvispora]|uniref:Gem-associated protein 2 n=1 Tax=Entomortierella parvispora TaxID=205924 RepID=A0A9P3HF23_9FUNG|nr:gem associated protein 2 [Entomortierella parvispora]